MKSRILNQFLHYKFMTVGHLSHQHQRFVPFLTIKMISILKPLSETMMTVESQIFYVILMISHLWYNFAEESDLRVVPCDWDKWDNWYAAGDDSKLILTSLVGGRWRQDNWLAERAELIHFWQGHWSFLCKNIINSRQCLKKHSFVEYYRVSSN